MAESLRQATQKRLTALKSERSSWESQWRDISRVLVPHAGRFDVTDRNRGDRRDSNIYDNTGRRAHRILAAGLMAGMTSPARPWFELQASDPDLNDFSPVKDWLFVVKSRMREVFNRSNVYRSLHGLYSELGSFATGAALLAFDFDEVVRGVPFTAGEYWIGTDHLRRVDTFYREYQMTVGQLVQEFGKDAVSSTVRNLYTNGQLDSWVTVVHAIEPRRDREQGKRDNKNMPWRSVYFEQSADADALLRESGFEEFPVLAPRWDVVGGDVYGSTCPGMEALGDLRQLQQEQLRKAEAIDYQTRPPIIAPTSMKDGADFLPGGVSYYDGVTGAGQSPVRSAYDVPLRLDFLLADIMDVRERINNAFYVDLFLMLANDPRSNITAREVAERHEEKLLMLGPVLERLHSELLAPLIDRTFAVMARSGMLPPAPEELQGQPLNVEYVSLLAQAQRAIGVGSIDRLMMTVQQVAVVQPQVVDKIDGDQIVDEVALMVGAPPRTVRSDDDVAALRQKRAEAEQAQNAAVSAMQMAQGAKTLSEVNTQDRNGLTDTMRMLQGA